MTWTKLADGLPRHPKIVGLSDAAFRLHIYALCYASEQLTDGEIPAVSVPILAPKRAKKLTEELVLAGVWHDENHACSSCPPIARGRYYLHGYLDYNQSAEEVEAARAQRSDKARRAARARWDHTKPDAPPDAPSIHGADAEQMPHDAPSRPVPTQQNSSSDALHDATEPAAEEAIRIEATTTAALARIVDHRLAARGDIECLPAYRRTVERQVDSELAERCRRLVADHTAEAPLDGIVAALLNEPNSLRYHRRPQEATA